MIRERMADNKRYGWRAVFGSWDGLMDDGSGSIVAVVDELCIKSLVSEEDLVSFRRIDTSSGFSASGFANQSMDAVKQSL